MEKWISWERERYRVPFLNGAVHVVCAFLIGQFLFGRCHGSVVGDYVINLCSSIEHSQVDV